MKYTLNPAMSINETLKKCVPGDQIYLENGIYNEKVEIDIDNITIIGQDEDNVIIQNHDFYHKIMADYNECNTFRTFTLYVGSNNVKLSNLTIKNTSVPSKRYGQAVALHVDGDNFKAENITLDSAQDTLFTGPLPRNLIEKYKGFLKDKFRKTNTPKHIFENCTIKGDVDFIFGCAIALFKDCTIVSINRNSNDGPNGFVAAPAHREYDEYGYLFLNCDLIAEAGVKDVYLARPWRDYGCAAFIDCNLGNHINKPGFDKWGNTNRDKTARFYEYSQDVDLSERVKWSHQFTEAEAKDYVDKFLKIVEYK